MRARLAHPGALVLLCVACSGESAPKPETGSPVKDAAADGKPRDASVERIQVPDGLADSFAPDRAIWHGAQFLTSSHPGWKRTDCLSTGCHPYASSDKPPVYKCATCHGGNGACNPNGAASGKQDHTSASACTGAGCHAPFVHPQGSTYTEDVQCVTCHFAKRGGTPDC